MKKTRMMMFSLVLFGLLLVAVPAQAASASMNIEKTIPNTSLKSDTLPEKCPVFSLFYHPAPGITNMK